MREQSVFPHTNPNYDGNWDKNPQRDGMTLRDWFAGQALQGVLAGYWANPRSRGSGQEDFAAWAYAQADAMLAARSQEKRR